LRRSPRWNNTIVVMVADHGYPYPSGLRCFDPKHYHIPMVIAGGAVREPREISWCCQQVDWVPTVLHQMGLPANQFIYAKDILDSRMSPFAYYNFVDGFALIHDASAIVFDATSNRVLIGSDTLLVQQAKALTQHIMQTIDTL